MRIPSALLAALILFASFTEDIALPAAKSPIIIGHRGACGYRPEHTLASYELAVELGADFIEPDLVSTSDGVLVARHENEISGTTDVAVKFPERKAMKTIDGQPVEGWFTEDFTLAELKTLRARERLEFRDQSFNGKFEIPTFREIIALAKRKSAETGRVIGIYPETKHPTYFRSIGLNLEEPLVRELKDAGWDKADSPVFIQSFEVANLKDLKKMIDVPLIQLFEEPDMRPYDFVVSGDPRTYADLCKPSELKGMAAYAAGIGPWKRLIVGETPDKSLKAPSTLVRDAHAAGLLVHPYTFRNEARFLAAEYGGDPRAEYIQFFELGVDGLFSDFSDTSFASREKFLKR
ncbi:glycerophosphodiester phosphodiesterase [Fundidesulfovibrio terrae]|uniref:glycerophosphodiester phosphodiesterase n=1 Tax=Fundidesulfovibrio terrae TaxID=2922866 RepID=UPI001FAF8BE9|nr:glycerophosphodiester phosphodiesterase [Fundidesulfovibrio terrae]